MPCGEFVTKTEYDGGKRWMVLKPENAGDIIHYQVNMLAYNEINGIAPLHIRSKNSDIFFCYEIGAGITQAFINGQFVYENQFIDFFCKVADVLSDSRRLMLEEKRFLLDWELIYTDQKGEPCLLYYPAELSFDTLKAFKELVFGCLNDYAVKAGLSLNDRAVRFLEELKIPGLDVNALRNELLYFKKSVIAYAEQEKDRQVLSEAPIKKKFGTYTADKAKPQGPNTQSGLQAALLRKSDAKEISQKLFSVSSKVTNLIFVISIQVIAVSLSIIADWFLKNKGVLQYQRYSILCTAVIIINAALLKGILNGQKKNGGTKTEPGETDFNAHPEADEEAVAESDPNTGSDAYREAHPDTCRKAGQKGNAKAGSEPGRKAGPKSVPGAVHFEIGIAAKSGQTDGKSIDQTINQTKAQKISDRTNRQKAGQWIDQTGDHTIDQETGQKIAEGGSDIASGKPISTSDRNTAANTGLPCSAETTLLCEISRKAWLKRSLTHHETAAEINRRRFIIGRNPETCDMIIPVKTVGRIHAEILNREGVFFLIDKNSKNGTFINGRKLGYNEECRLCSGDIVVFSQEKYFFIL